MKSIKRLVLGREIRRTALAFFTAIPAFLVQCGIPVLLLADDDDAGPLDYPDPEFSFLPSPPSQQFPLGPGRLALRGPLPDASLRQFGSRGPVLPRAPPIV